MFNVSFSTIISILDLIPRGILFNHEWRGQLVEKNAAVAHQRDNLKTKLLIELMIDNGVVSKEPDW